MRVLQLDVSERPMDLIGMFDAVAKVAMGRAEILEWDENILFRGPINEGLEQLVIPKPIVIKVPHYVQLKPYATKHVIRRVLYARDKWLCQYCGKPLSRATATIDHVKPLSRGGSHTWDNVVAACKRCNSKKADHMPWEVRMYPIGGEAPKAPHFVQTAFAGRLEGIQKQYIARYYPKLDLSVL